MYWTLPLLPLPEGLANKMIDEDTGRSFANVGELYFDLFEHLGLGGIP